MNDESSFSILSSVLLFMSLMPLSTLRQRHSIKKKEVKKILDELEKIFSCKLFTEKDRIEMASTPKREVLLVNGEIDVFIIDGKPFLTLMGLMRYEPKKRFVTVDMGAISYIVNGADIMTPGIVDADVEIKEKDVVWIRDEKNGKPLAVGIALMDGKKMVEAKKGKAVESIHHVGDDLWNTCG